MTRLTALQLGDPAEVWQQLGFTVTGSAVPLGEVTLELGCAGQGIVGWRLDGVDSVSEIDGLRTARAARPVAGARHPNGAIGLDHVVIMTPDFDRTAAALAAAGIPLRRVRDAPGGFRQGFRRLGPAILELVEARAGPGAAPGPTCFWGLVVIVADLDALAERLGEHLGQIRPAVQAGRRIATLRSSAGVGTAVAFMDPEGS